MPKEETTKDDDTKPMAGDKAEAQVAEEMKGSAFAQAVESDQGFLGAEVDPTPNENYTVEGVTSGAPTPETDDATYDATLERRREIRDLMTPEGTSRGREAD